MYGPTEVYSTYYVCFIQEYSMVIHLEQSWKDPRLTFDKEHGGQKIDVGSDRIYHIWRPDVIIRNAKTYKLLEVAGSMGILVRITHEGRVWVVYQ